MLLNQVKANLSLLAGSDIKKIAVAVSGGSDSVALLVLLSKIAKEMEAEILVLTVDHDLRQESKEEVEYVKSLSSRLGHECAQLKWDHGNNFSNIQSRARDARYSLMTKVCKERDIHLLCTAHHADDFLETFLIRKQRKSGLFGLSSSYKYFVNEVMIIRPLFNISKKQLSDYLKAENIRWYEDKSNISEKYQRGVVRKYLEQQGESYKNRFSTELQEINDRAESLKEKLVKAVAEFVTISELGFAEVSLCQPELTSGSLSFFEDDHFEIKLQLLAYVLTIISGKNKLPRADSVKLILSAIEEKGDFTKTLHGCILKRRGDMISVFREFGRKLPEALPLKKGTIWDNRYCYVGKEIAGAVITHLTPEDYSQVKERLTVTENARFLNIKNALFTLPVVKVLEKIVFIPHISYYHNTDEEEKKNFYFSPSFVSRFTHFC